MPFTLVIGGLGFSTDQIGTALLCVAAPLLFLQMWAYPKVRFKQVPPTNMPSVVKSI